MSISPTSNFWELDMDHQLTLKESLLRTASLKKAAAARLKLPKWRIGNLDSALKGLNRKREAKLDSRKKDYELMMSNVNGRAYKASAGAFHRPGSFT